MSQSSYYEYDEYCDEYDECSERNENGFECEYDESDIWYALTDGMYGDYPGGSVDLDMFGF